MKRLLLLPFLSLMPSAQAMDYVKCEAIQNASGRVTAARGAEFQKLLASYLEAAGCMDMSDRLDQLYCKRDVLESKAAFNRANDELKRRYETRLAKIQADYEAEGCY